MQLAGFDRAVLSKAAVDGLSIYADVLAQVVATVFARCAAAALDDIVNNYLVADLPAGYLFAYGFNLAVVLVTENNANVSVLSGRNVKYMQVAAADTGCDHADENFGRAFDLRLGYFHDLQLAVALKYSGQHSFHMSYLLFCVDLFTLLFDTCLICFVNIS